MQRPKVFTNLNLNHGVPARAQPGLGEWGPADVLSTKKKKRQRIWATLAFLVAFAAVMGLGYWVWTIISGH